jgi:hypothetical protein
VQLPGRQRRELTAWQDARVWLRVGFMLCEHNVHSPMSPGNAGTVEFADSVLAARSCLTLVGEGKGQRDLQRGVVCEGAGHLCQTGGGGGPAGGAGHRGDGGQAAAAVVDCVQAGCLTHVGDHLRGAGRQAGGLFAQALINGGYLMF